MKRDDNYYDGLEDYKFGVARQKKLDEKEESTMQQLKWGGFSRQFTRMADRDPNPHIPFVEIGPLLTRKEAAITIALGILGLTLLVTYIIVGVSK